MEDDAQLLLNFITNLGPIALTDERITRYTGLTSIRLLEVRNALLNRQCIEKRRDRYIALKPYYVKRQDDASPRKRSPLAIFEILQGLEFESLTKVEIIELINRDFGMSFTHTALNRHGPYLDRYRLEEPKIGPRKYTKRIRHEAIAV